MPENNDDLHLMQPSQLSNQKVNVTLSEKHTVTFNSQNFVVTGFLQQGQDLVINLEGDKTLTLENFFLPLNFDFLVLGDAEDGLTGIQIGDETVRPADFISAIFNALNNQETLVFNPSNNSPENLLLDINNEEFEEESFLMFFSNELNSAVFTNIIAVQFNNVGDPIVVLLANVNTPPSALNDFIQTNANMILDIPNVLVNDFDVDGDLINLVSIDTSGTRGIVTNIGDGTFTYNPNGVFDPLFANVLDNDSFTYTISDNQGGFATGTVTITVRGINDPLVANDDMGLGFSTTEDDSFTTANVLDNDFDPDPGDFKITAGFSTTGTQGIVTDNTNGTFNYNPNGQFEFLQAGETAIDSFQYIVIDSRAAVSPLCQGH